ncbi:MAG: class I SAM-dependent methyltransferase [Acidimicrobiia bacterium]
MTPAQPFDPITFKEAQRTDWEIAARGWRKWYDVLEGGGQIVSRTLVELAGIGPSDTVLDVATGYGEPALTAARIVAPTGRVLAADISANMLDFGRERAARAGLDNVEFLEADTEALSFESDTFDAILSRQGLQFLPDVPGTLERFHTFLKRDGRLAAAVWGAPETVQFARPVSVILEALDLPAPPASGPGIFALADPDALVRLVTDAGFRDVETGTVMAVYETPSPEDFTQWARDVAPPIVNLLKGQSPETKEQVWRKVTAAWAPFTTADGRVRTENQAVWVAATK